MAQLRRVAAGSEHQHCDGQQQRRGGARAGEGEGESFCRSLANLEDGVRKEQRSNFLEIGKLLTEILDSELYVLKGYKSFVKYVDDEPLFRFTGKHAIRLVRTYRFVHSLPRGASLPTSERQVRPLIKLAFEDARDVWLEAQRLAKEEAKPVTGELVAELVAKLNSSRRGGLREATNSRKVLRSLPAAKRRHWGSDQGHNGLHSDYYYEEEEDEDEEDGNGSGSGSGSGGVEEEFTGGRRDGEGMLCSRLGNVTQAAVLLLAEFERLRERVKELPQQHRERLLVEWKHAMDEDLDSIQSSNGSQQWMDRCKKQKLQIPALSHLELP